ncbi:MAG TPA: SRPBCC family protein [Gemmatimonadaceae bacterium]|nr:SRPBCC family protein [Gemmatimonadaceae bacterium]
MPITSVSSNPQDLTLTVVADYPVPVERLWDAYADPRQLERFWGPEQWPATFLQHDMAVGGRSHYYMTGPDGTISRGWFRFLAVEPLQRIEVEDGFSDAAGEPNAAMPSMRMVFHFESTPTGSRFRSVTTFPSLEAMEQLVQMGMMEGMRSAMGQIDAVLADLASFAASRGTEAQLLSDTQVRISRVIRGSAAQVWRAHHEPALMKRWLLGPDGWTMPVCEVATEVGQRYRFEWEQADASQRFGFEGELLEIAPPYRSVTTESMIGMPGPATRNELTLTPVQEGTLLSLLITYPSREVRDMILGTGMTTGMETSYARLEREVLAAA